MPPPSSRVVRTSDVCTCLDKSLFMTGVCTAAWCCPGPLALHSTPITPQHHTPHSSHLTQAKLRGKSLMQPVQASAEGGQQLTQPAAATAPAMGSDAFAALAESQVQPVRWIGTS
jgi:hypothetical protein